MVLCEVCAVKLACLRASFCSAMADCKYGCCTTGRYYCHHWLRSGWCGKDARCRYRHSVPEHMRDYSWSHWNKNHRQDEPRSSDQPDSSQSAPMLPSLKRTCEEAIHMMSLPKHKKPNQACSTLDDLETFAMYSGPDERLPCYYEDAEKKEGEGEGCQAFNMHAKSDQAVQPTKPKKMPRKMHVRFKYMPPITLKIFENNQNSIALIRNL